MTKEERAAMLMGLLFGWFLGLTFGVVLALDLI